MKVSYQWLCEMVDIKDVTPQELAEKLTSAGLTVDGVEPRVESIEGVVVGLVKECDQHPNADRLRVCQVEVNEGDIRTIVCGAPNVAAGQKVPVAVSGSTLPGGKIGKAKLRGVESNGMLCSAKEIGLEVKLLPKEQTEGLYILPDDAPIGADIVKYLHLDDYILDVDLTPNRSDCLSIRGLAYEVAALYGRTAVMPELDDNGSTDESPLEVRIDTERCSQYDAQVITLNESRRAPIWMEMRLLTMGVRPISGIVDVTNYVMLEWGQPLHAFDFDKVHAQTIVVRQAADGEEIVTLDGERRTLTDDSIVIADVERAIGIAGVMGGENSEITSSTLRVVLESAAFDAPSVRRTGQRLGLRSEAQQRFEKGIDIVTIRAALIRASNLYTSIFGAELVGKPVSVRAKTGTSAYEKGALGKIGFAVSFSPARCRQLLGADIEDALMRDVFERLLFDVDPSGETWNVVVPTRRPDVRLEADLVEEVARFVGYDAIPSTLPEGKATVGVRTLRSKIQQDTRRILIDCGMNEVFTYAFTRPALLDALRIPEDSPYRTMIGLALPMSEERTHLRTHLLPSLAQVGAYNLAYGNAGGQIFEVARVYLPKSLPLSTQPMEPLKWAGLWFGVTPGSIYEQSRPYDFYDAKGIVDAWLIALGLEGRVEYVRTELSWFHPGRSAAVLVDGTEIGTIGELHPETADSFELPRAIYVEFDITSVEQVVNPSLRVKPLPRFPSSRRDLAVLVDHNVDSAELIHTATSAVGKGRQSLLESCTVFDAYQGKGIPQGQVSLAFAFVYRAPDRTLTDEEINDMERSILDAWVKTFAAVLRS